MIMWLPPLFPLQSMVRELKDQDGSLPSLVSKSRHNRGGVSLLSYLSNPSHTSITSNHSPQSPCTPRYCMSTLQDNTSFISFIRLTRSWAEKPEVQADKEKSKLQKSKLRKEQTNEQTEAQGNTRKTEQTN